MREMYFKEAVKKYGASKVCNLEFEVKIVDATDTSGKALKKLDSIKTNCGYDAFQQLKKEYANEIKFFGPSAMLMVVQK